MWVDRCGRDCCKSAYFPRAVLLQAILTIFADLAGIYHTAHTGKVPGFEFLYVRAHLRNFSNDFMAWHHRENAREPFVPDLVKIGVADAAKVDLDLNVMGADVPSFKFPGSQVGFGCLSCVCFCLYHVRI